MSVVSFAVWTYVIHNISVSKARRTNETHKEVFIINEAVDINDVII